MILRFDRSDGAGAYYAPLAMAGSSSRESRSTLRLEERVVQLFDELRAPVSRYLLSLGSPPPETEEIVQETFLRLFEHLLKEGREENLRSWVFRVAHNLAVDRRRSGRFVVATDTDEWLRLYDSTGLAAPSPEELLLRKEKMLRLQSAVRGLTDQERQCFELRAEGFRYREIAEILGVGTTTVADALRRVVQVLAREAHE